MLVDAATRGMGIAQVFDFMVRPLLETGRLVEVLAPHAVEGPPLNALASARRASIPRVRALLDALVESLGAAGRPNGGRPNVGG
jgi:DNA-binding transcriptional LysR family regulator